MDRSVSWMMGVPGTGMEEASSIGCWQIDDVVNSNPRARLYIDPAGRESARLVADD